MKINNFPSSTSAVFEKIISDKAPVKTPESSFGNTLKKAINEVNQLHLKADQSVDEIASGKEPDIHKTMIALEKADVSFKLMMQLRNKALEAYQEIMRIQV